MAGGKRSRNLRGGRGKVNIPRRQKCVESESTGRKAFPEERA